jgi:hypothetical protein
MPHKGVTTAFSGAGYNDDATMGQHNGFSYKYYFENTIFVQIILSTLSLSVRVRHPRNVRHLATVQSAPSLFLHWAASPALTKYS